MRKEKKTNESIDAKKPPSCVGKLKKKPKDIVNEKNLLTQ